MKTKIIIIALIAITGITSHLFGQELVSKSEEFDLEKNIKCKITPTEYGYSLEFQYYTKPLTNVAMDQASRKKRYDHYISKSEYSVSYVDNTITEIKSPRDAASGIATGKRQHQPIGITSSIDKSTPYLYKRESSNGTTAEISTAMVSGGGVGKVNMQDIHFTKRCTGNSSIFLVTNGESVIPTDECPNGNCELKIEWTWNDGTLRAESDTVNPEVTRNSVIFVLKIEDGVCTAMAINEKGLPGEKATKTKPKN